MSCDLSCEHMPIHSRLQWPWAELDLDQQRAIEWGVAGHCSRTALRTDGSVGLHNAPVVVLDFASLYPSVFIAHNICYSTLLPPNAHNTHSIPHYRTYDTVLPNSRVAGADNDSLASDSSEGGRRWPGDGIAFVREECHEGILPRVLRALLAERRAVKRRIKELDATNVQLAAVLDARQLTLKLLAVRLARVTPALITSDARRHKGSACSPFVNRMPLTGFAALTRRTFAANRLRRRACASAITSAV